MSKSIYTFWGLINEFPIIIPQVQRDYAYGRDDEKAQEVSTNILNSIHEVLIPSSLSDSSIPPLTMDFVYGNIKDNVGLTPLDGQQRLTTLFLLHLYASIIDDKVQERTVLKKFCYETRQSANNFCKNLIDDFTYSKDFKTKKLSAQILNNPKCLPNYKDDPTISSMLVILDKIADMFSDVKDIWIKLTEEERIIFYFLPLNRFGLSDDLYIKMNSRGKSLTEYELFKSDFLEFLSDKHPDFKQIFSESLDGRWTDVLWRNAEIDAKNNKCVSSVDDGFIKMFSNVSVLLYHLRTNSNFSEMGGKESTYLDSPIEEQFRSESDIQFLYDTFNVVEEALNGTNVDTYWNNLFYLNDNVLSEDSDRIRLFWREKENIFLLMFRRRLTRAQMIMFYAVFLGIKLNIDLNILHCRLRHLRNLLVNSEFQLRGSKVHGMLTETETYISKGVMPSGDYFNSIQVDEEIEKDSLPDWQSLWKFENHFILKGSIGLFLKTESTSLLPKFAELFNEKYWDNTTLLRQAILIAGEGGEDYMQYQAYMENTKYKQRWFVCRPDQWSSFFTWNQQRHNQEAIIKCLNSLPKNVSDLEQYISNGLSNISKKSWKYYMVRYPNDWNTSRYDSQGIYHWDDYATKPLEVIMLNSSYHSDYNLEWNILNLTLSCAFPDDHCTVDPHGHSPIKLLKANAFLNAVQDGWVLSTYENNFPFKEIGDIKFGNDGIKKYSLIDSVSDTDGLICKTILVPNDTDYNEFGIELINDIESIYADYHKHESASNSEKEQEQ